MEADNGLTSKRSGSTIGTFGTADDSSEAPKDLSESLSSPLPKNREMAGAPGSGVDIATDDGMGAGGTTAEAGGSGAADSSGANDGGGAASENGAAGGGGTAGGGGAANVGGAAGSAAGSGSGGSGAGGGKIMVGNVAIPYVRKPLITADVMRSFVCSRYISQQY